ncbi:tRNA pseudouridine 55 synthase [Salmonella enterica subsp. arizonae]|uniref:tRNA pseudouridine(55) synthase n=1 Tax=Salmonella enterica subsp. arizonae TaxID=59203 RepID=A0A379RWU2_SALER|nr:tRNA pseudouridine 55 synthase [Salmonella enterica subsp. arizonae]
MSRPRRRGRDIHGVLLLDKPQGMSSNDVLQKVKRIYNANRAGHTGALDPLATGMLPICLGEATKFSQYLLDSDKRYRVIARLGQRTDTSDADGPNRTGASGDFQRRAACERAGDLSWGYRTDSVDVFGAKVSG